MLTPPSPKEYAVVQQAVARDEVQIGDTIKIGIGAPAEWHTVAQTRQVDGKYEIQVSDHQGFLTLRSPYYQVQR